MAKKSQIQKFREAARAAGADDSERRFNEALKALAKDRRSTAAAKGASDAPRKRTRATKVAPRHPACE